MSATGFSQGHEIVFLSERWVYSDTLESIDNIRKCKHCNLLPTKEGHDACLGNLPGVEYACCGHGDREKSYIKFTNGMIIRGSEMIVTTDIPQCEGEA